MRKTITSLVLLYLFSAYAFGVGHVINAKITTVYCGYPGTYDMCSLTFSKPIESLDACHTLVNSQRMQFKPDTAIGKAILSIALTAHSTQKNVDVYSTGGCTIYTGLSDVNWITIKDN